MKFVARKSAAAVTWLVLSQLAITTACYAQSEVKTFGKIDDGPNSLTVKAIRAASVSHGVKTWKRQLEIIIYRSFDTSNFWSDEHYTDQDTESLRKALTTLTARYQLWKGKHLGTQQQEIEVRKADDTKGIHNIVIDLQMDEMGKIAIVLAQGTVAIETSATNLPKFRAYVNNAVTWLSATQGTPAGKKPGK